MEFKELAVQTRRLADNINVPIALLASRFNSFLHRFNKHLHTIGQLETQTQLVFTDEFGRAIMDGWPFEILAWKKESAEFWELYIDFRQHAKCLRTHYPLTNIIVQTNAIPNDCDGYPFVSDKIADAAKYHLAASILEERQFDTDKINAYRAVIKDYYSLRDQALMMMITSNHLNKTEAASLLIRQHRIKP